MSKHWRFTHTVECPVSRDIAWAFWTNVKNWAAVDPALESAELDGSFATGTMGRTKPHGQAPVRWRLVEVHDCNGAVIEIPAPGAVLRFRWEFEDTPSGGTRLTQQVSIEGPQADGYASTVGQEMEKGIPQGMRRLADAIVRAAGEQA